MVSHERRSCRTHSPAEDEEQTGASEAEVAEDDEAERMAVDWEAHPALAILSVTRSGGLPCPALSCPAQLTSGAAQCYAWAPSSQRPPHTSCCAGKYVVLRDGCGLADYGLVDGAAAKMQRLGEQASGALAKMQLPTACTSRPNSCTCTRSYSAACHPGGWLPLQRLQAASPARCR